MRQVHIQNLRPNSWDAAGQTIDWMASGELTPVPGDTLADAADIIEHDGPELSRTPDPGNVYGQPVGCATLLIGWHDVCGVDYYCCLLSLEHHPKPHDEERNDEDDR